MYSRTVQIYAPYIQQLVVVEQEKPILVTPHCSFQWMLRKHTNKLARVLLKIVPRGSSRKYVFFKHTPRIDISCSPFKMENPMKMNEIWRYFHCRKVTYPRYSPILPAGLTQACKVSLLPFRWLLGHFQDESRTSSRPVGGSLGMRIYLRSTEYKNDQSDQSLLRNVLRMYTSVLHSSG